MLIQEYIQKQATPHRDICELLSKEIDAHLPDADSKIWHGAPVWFLDGNPIVGYSVQKAGTRLMFWSGRSFDEPHLTGTSRFKDASIFYNDVSEVDTKKLATWLNKSTEIQWDYKNIVKRKGKLERLK